MFTNIPHNPSQVDQLSPLHAGLDAGIITFLVGAVMGHPELADRQMGVAEIYLGFNIEAEI